jgi:chromosome segregation ATPase
MSEASRGDLRTIANGLFPAGGEVATLSPAGRDEVREAVEVILRLSSHDNARLTLALEQLDKAADEVERLNAERDSTLKEFKLTLEANAGLRAELARLEAETDSLRAAVDDLRALNAQLSATSAAKKVEMRDRAEKAEASNARLWEAAEWMVSASDNRLPTAAQDGQHPSWIRMGIDGLRRALAPRSPEKEER